MRDSDSSKGLKLVIYDDTCRSRGVGLTHSWIAGVGLYRGLRRIDRSFGVSSWQEALDAVLALDAPIQEIQFWGHGKWGQAHVDRDVLDRWALYPGHRLYDRLDAVRERLGPDSRWWFRTCETLGCEAGHGFARAWSDFFETEVAGHTYIIGPWQSGLHRLGPGEIPTWSEWEGLVEGTPNAPKKARWSKPTEPQTISCLRSSIPRDWR